ncbi:MAG: LacI family transcriptional regulator, partial [Paracoccaceae bacterium]
TAAMAAVTGAELSGLKIGRDFDIFAKEAIPFLHRFRREMIVLREDVDKAGSHLARALVAAIENPTRPAAQALDQPQEFDWE